ncbi:MAG: hypothetical protein IPM95_11295 [Sphingobacteriales bacterium]|nr:hypothetical protein [Sphingobacteriales bacterium]
MFAPIFIFLLMLLVRYRINIKPSEVKRRYLLKAFWFKVFCTIFFAAIYQYYYRGGDTNTYFLNIQNVHNVFYENPLMFFKIVFSIQPDFFEYEKYLGRSTYFYADPSVYAVIRIGALLSFPLLKTYMLIALTFSMFCLYGCWKIFELFHRLYPHLEKELAVACLFLPSVGFWGSGILKDPLCMGALGALTYHAYRLFFDRDKVVRRVIMIAICLIMIKVIKVYILLSFLPAYSFWLIFHFKENINSKFIKALMSPMLFAASSIMGVFVFIKIAQISNKYALENLVRTAKDTQNWIYYSSQMQGGSGYTLGEVDYTLKGLLKIAPKAINVTLFRPYIWEARKPILIPAALEGLISLFLTIRLLYKSGFIRFTRLILTNPEVQFCLVFSLIFAFSVGFTSYNFGSLVRYKIPLMPFYFIALFILADREKQEEIKEKTILKPKPTVKGLPAVSV